MKLTLKGDDLLGTAEVMDGRRVYEAPVPDEALPDCESCEKPELFGANADAVLVYGDVSSDQQRAPMSAHIFGVRYEAKMAALQYHWEAGNIGDIDDVKMRVDILDAIACRIANAKADADEAKRKAESEAGRK